MIRRDVPLQTRAGGNWFSVDLGERGPHLFRVPRAMVRAELRSALVASNMDASRDEVEAGLNSSDPDMLPRVRASEEAMGACLGTCWRHATLDLETKRHAFADSAQGLRRYGDAVLDELEDAGYSEADIKTLLEGVIPRILSAVFPGAQEVAERATSFPGP